MAGKRESRSAAGKAGGNTPAAGSSGAAGFRQEAAAAASPPAGKQASRTTRSPQAQGAKARQATQVIPDAVANRMMRRIAVATGVPTLLGMAVIVASYLLVSRHLLDIPPSATLLASGAFFLLGLLGLTYGVVSASWEPAPGTLLGMEQIPLNLSRIRGSLRALRAGSAPRS